MPRQQGPFDWQGRLESEGSVSFGPARWTSWVMFTVAVVALLGLLYAVVTDPAVWSLVGVLLLAACSVATGRAALLGTSRLTVTHEGFAAGRHAVVPFDRLGAVSISRRNLTVHYLARPTRQRMMIVTLPRFGAFHPDDLAVWMLKLKGGPSADVVEDATSGVSRVFRLREQFGELPGSRGGGAAPG